MSHETPKSDAAWMDDYGGNQGKKLEGFLFLARHLERELADKRFKAALNTLREEAI